jgi:hypothetical protein
LPWYRGIIGLEEVKSTSRRDWRKIAGDIGIIVIGVLIALGGRTGRSIGDPFDSAPTQPKKQWR